MIRSNVFNVVVWIRNFFNVLSENNMSYFLIDEVEVRVIGDIRVLDGNR